MTLDESIAMIVGANESVQDASVVGTSLKSMAINLGGMKVNAKEGTLELNKTAKALKELAGIDVYSDKQTGQVKDMMEILNEVNEVYDDLSQDKQLALGEAIAGKHHANTFQALMGNWETVLEYQNDYKNGFTVGSAAREQEKYLDSIEGKWNVLKENLKSLVTTTISSDFTKGLLDGAIALTDGLNNVIRFLDEINMALPVTIGLMTALGQSFKALSGNGQVNLIGKGFKDNIKDLTTMTTQYKTAGAALSGLQSKQLTLSKSTVKGSGEFKRYSTSLDTTGKSVIRVSGAFDKFESKSKTTAKSMGQMAKSFSQTAVGSKLAMVGTSLLNGALISLAVAGIGAAIKAFDNYINRHEIAAEQARDNIDSINGEIKGYKSQKSSLENIADEYDKLASKTNKSAEELERFNELKNEIATIMPELVIGYDDGNNPILSMTGDAQDLIKELDRAIESKNRLLKSEENALRISATETAKKDIKELEKSMAWIQGTLNGGGLNLNNALKDESFFGTDRSLKKRAESVVKALQEEEKAYTEHYNKYLDDLQKYYAKEQEIQKANLTELFGSDKYKGLADNMASEMNSFASTFDWMDFDLSGQKRMVRGMEDLSEAISQGKFDIEDFNDRWQSINDTFQNTGDIESYNKSINGLAKELESLTGVDAAYWVEGLAQQFEGLDYADAKLNKFLQSYNSSLDQLANGDSLAISLQKQYDELMRFTDLLHTEIITTGKIGIEPLVEIKESESFKYLPKQMQTLIDGVIADGEVTEAEQDILLSLNTIIANEGALSKDVGEKLNRVFTGTATEQDLEVGVKIGDFEIPPDLLKILNNEYKDQNLNVDFTVNGLDELEKANKQQSEMDGKQTESTHKQKVEGKEDLEKAKQDQDSQNGKKTESTHQVKTEGVKEAKEDVKELNEESEKANKEINLSVNNGELQGSVEEFSKLVEYSTKLEDGTYSISFKSDTADAIAQIDNLKLAVNNLSNQFMHIPPTTVTIHTAQAAQNLSGLITRINQTKQAISTMQGKTINIVTALAAQNLSGLIVRVNQYKSAILSTTDKTINIHTTTAAKNLSGTISKIQQYNGVKIPAKTVKVNVAQAISALNSVISKIKSIPSSKTVNVRVNQSGSVQNGRSTFSLQSSIENIVKTYNVANEVVDATNITPNQISTLSDIPSVFSKTRATIKTPLAINDDNINKSIKYSIELLKELENRMKAVSNQLSILDKKMKHATGEEKIKYLEEQNKLYQEQLQHQKELESALNKQQTYYKNFLSSKGFQFTSDGNLKNYEEKLLAMEKEAERLEEIASKDKASDSQKKASEDYKNNLEEIKKYLNEYIQVAYEDLPGVTEEFIDINNAIQDNINSIKEFEREIAKLKEDSKYKNENRDIWEIENKLDKNDALLETAVGKEKIKLLEERVSLYEELKKEKQDLLELENETREGLMNDLGKYGFTFRDDGSIEGYGQKIEKLKKTLTDDEFDNVYSMVEDYLDSTYQKIPELENKIIGIGDSIREAQNQFDYAPVEDIDKEIERAEEEELLGLLKEKLELLQQVANKKQEYIDLLQQEADKTKGELEQSGIKFNDDGSIQNYEETIKSLQQSLKNATGDSAKEIEIILSKLESYVKATESDIPKAVEEWKDAQDQIKETGEEIEDVEKKQADFLKDRAEAVRKATEDIMKVTQDLLQTQMNINQKHIDMIEKSMELSSFDPKQSFEALEKQIDLLEKQKELQTQMGKELEKQKNYYKDRLVSFGITFDDKGIATNAEDVLNKIKNQMANASDSDELDALEEKFNDIVGVLGDYNGALEDIVDNQSDLMDLQLEIEGVYENMLETTKKIEDKITSIIEKQVEERKKLIDEELKKRLDSISKQKEAYNKQREEDKYQKEYDDKLKELSDLQAKIDAVSKDTSMAGQAKLAELLEEFNKKQEEFNEMVQDQLDKEINEAFDKESDRLEDQAQEEKDKLDEILDKENLQEIIKDALNNGKLTNIDGSITDLKDALLEYEDKYGDGLSVIGGLIKKDLLNQLDISLDTMKNIEDILKNLNLSDFYKSNAFSFEYPSFDAANYSTVSNQTFSFNEPLIVVQGNITKDVMPDLNRKIDDMERRITKNIINATR